MPVNMIVETKQERRRTTLSDREQRTSFYRSFEKATCSCFQKTHPTVLDPECHDILRTGTRGRLFLR